jgi:hypothetical protein
MTSSKPLVPEVKFDYSLEMEARRVLYLAAKLPDRVLQDRGFLILPYRTSNAPTGTLYFPDLEYRSIGGFWERVSRLKLETPIKAPPTLLTQFMSLLQPLCDIKRYHRSTQAVKSSWNEVDVMFWDNLFTLFPSYRSYISQVNIYLTQYGPYSSFSLPHNAGDEVTIYLRDDTSVEQLMWTILTCHFRPKMQRDLKLTWEEIEAVVDFLMHESRLSCGLGFPSPTLRNLRSDQMAKYRHDSARFLNKLQVPLANRPWRKNGRNVYYGEIKVVNLSQNEQMLLEVLLAKQGSTVTYEDIMISLWGENNEISDWALTKQVERLRRKLAKLNIPRHVIQAHRKIGYSVV